MRRCISFLAVTLMAAFPLKAGDHTRYVDPFIGTEATENSLGGNVFPGASLPFGLVQLSPDTAWQPRTDPCSGYNYTDRNIYGFSHTHLSGTGVVDLIDVSFMPWTGEVTPSYLAGNDFHQRFSHDRESARPGYYQVFLEDSGVNVELSATTRTGIHRYTFPAGKAQHLILDLDHSGYRTDSYRKIIQSQIRIVDERTVEGYRIMTGWAKLRKVCFRAEFSRPIVSHRLMNGTMDAGAGTTVNGRALHADLCFDPADGEVLTVKVALSPVDLDGARGNLAAEAPGWDFDAYAEAADDIWEEALSRIDVDGPEDARKIFYTGLYHTLLQPNVVSDADGRYMDTDYSIRQLPEGEQYYSTFSLWDTFRTAHPLYTLICPDRAAGFIRSMLRHYDSYGYLPIWDLWGQDNYCMIGNHAIPVIADAIMKELPGFDVDRAFEAMVGSSTLPHLNSPFGAWEQYGYMPQNLQEESVSITLEQAFDDWCVAEIAEKLGKTDEAARFSRRAGFYRNLFDKDTGFFRAKDDTGAWVEPFDPFGYDAAAGNMFTEGNAWQYLWFVPQDPQGLIALFGGEKPFLEKLDACFSIETSERQEGGNASGFIGQYAHGNEPSHHTVYLYNFGGRPYRTQELVDEVRTRFYSAGTGGYAGNDDCGQMSAWYIFSAMGFYPFNAGSGTYVIGTPLFRESVIHLPDGRDFTVRARKASRRVKDGAIYVKSVSLNGKPLKDLSLSHRDILEGGVLEFVMTDRRSEAVRI